MIKKQSRFNYIMKIIISYLNIKQNIFFKMSNYIDKRNTHFKKYIISPSKNFGLVNTINDICEETKKGKQHILITKYQQKYGNSFIRRRKTICDIPYYIR